MKCPPPLKTPKPFVDTLQKNKKTAATPVHIPFFPKKAEIDVVKSLWKNASAELVIELLQTKMTEPQYDKARQSGRLPAVSRRVYSTWMEIIMSLENPKISDTLRC